MKALTLTQPWATLVAIGAKRIETRSWKTPYRGAVAIHAAKAWQPWDEAYAKELLGRGILPRLWQPGLGSMSDWFPRGAVVATVRLVNVVPIDAPGLARDPMEQLLEQWGGTHEREFGNYTPGRFAWLLADVQAVAPVSARGRLGLWEWTPRSAVDVVEEAVPFA